MIYALISNGNWMWLLIDETVTTQEFGIFLYLLSTFLNANWQTFRNRTIIVLDNASIHLTNSTKNIAAKHGMKILGLHPYWPHLAPVEFVFGLIKGHISNSDANKTIDFSKRSGKRAITAGLECLTKEKVLRMWKKVIMLARETISDAYERIHSPLIGLKTYDSPNEENKET